MTNNINLELKAAIIRRYRTQADFAADLRVPAPVVSEVINHRRQLKDEEVSRWCAYLGVEAEEVGFGHV
jgi:plasmid maintenance system antidote protein VapI